MTALQKRWIRMIHTARQKTCIDEDAYRAILSGAGVSSSTEITTWEQYRSVMAAFRKLGFVPRRRMQADTDGPRNPEWITEAQERYILGLWELASRRKDRKSLAPFLERIAGVRHVRFLKKADATKVILALRDMARKAGKDPGGGAYASDDERGRGASGSERGERPLSCDNEPDRRNKA